MLDIGWSELLVIAVVLIVVVGPKDLPPMIRAFGKTMAGLRKMAGDFRSQFDEALKEADMDDVRQTISDVRNLNPTNSIRDAMNPLRQLGNDLRNDLNGVTTSSTATSAPEGASAINIADPEMKLPDGPPPMAAPTAVAAAAAAPATVAAAPAAATPAPAPLAVTDKPKTPRKRAEKSVQEIEAEKVAAKPKRAAKTVSAKDEVAKPARKRASAAEPGSVALSKDAPKPSTGKAAKAAVEAAAPMVELAKSMVEPAGAGASDAKPVKKAKAKKGEA